MWLLIQTGIVVAFCSLHVTGHWLFQDCNTTAEAAFVLDSSSSVGKENFQTVLEFTQNVTELLSRAYERLNLTVITFNNDAKIAVQLYEQDLPTMLQSERNITYSHGGTQTNKAIELMFRAFSFDVNNPKIAILITDGTSFEQDKTRNASDYVKDNGVAMFVIGIGDEVNPHEITAMSSEPNETFAFKIQYFNDIWSLEKNFHWKRCIVCTGKAADVVFVDDTSGNIGIENFSKMKQFIKGVIVSLDTDPQYTRIALIKFDPGEHVYLKMNENATLTSLLNAIDYIPYSGGVTYTYIILQLMRIAGFDRERPDVPNIAIIITDRMANLPQNTVSQANYAKAEGVTIYTIGIGNRIDKGELTAIASGRNYVYETMTFETLFSLYSSVARNICTVKLAETYHTNNFTNLTKHYTCSDWTPDCASLPRDLCSNYDHYARKFCAKTCEFCSTCTKKAVDVVFVIEASTSIGGDNFQKIKEFIKLVVKAFDIGAQYTRVALIKYAAEPIIEFKMDETNNISVTLNAVDNTANSSGPAYTSLALQMMRIGGFDWERENVPKLAVVITDGPSWFPANTHRQAQLAKDEGVTIMTIGIGNNTDKDELTAIASDRKYVFEAKNYQELLTLDASVSRTACAVKQPQNQNSSIQAVDICADVSKDCISDPRDMCTKYQLYTRKFCAKTCNYCAVCVGKVVDVVFVVDSSGSIGLENFLKIKQFIKDVITIFDVGIDKTRVALIEYSTLAHIDFKLNEKSNYTDLLKAVDNVMYSGGGTATSDALELMRTKGFDRERPDVPDVVIVITAGLSKYPSITRNQANLAKGEGITMLAIGIGNLTDRDELLAIASDKRYLFEVSDYETLLTVDSIVAHTVCGVILPLQHYTRSPTTPTSNPSGCVDLSHGCASYPRDSCTDYELYARKNCARTCGYCPVEPACKDEVENCEQYGTAMCYNPSQYDWVDSHCRKFCRLCGNKTELLITTSPPGTTASTCTDKFDSCSSYNADLCTNPTYDAWARANCQKYCGFCYNYNYVTSAVVNQIQCPAWKLPEQCTLEYKNGQCWPLPKCPEGLRLMIKRHSQST